MSDSEKIATLLSQVRQKDEALRQARSVIYRFFRKGRPSIKFEEFGITKIIDAALSPTPQPDAAPADTVSMPKSTYLYLRGALSMLPEDALGFGNYADPQHGQPAQYPILRELQDRVDQLLPSTASPLPADDVIEAAAEAIYKLDPERNFIGSVWQDIPWGMTSEYVQDKCRNQARASANQ